MAPRLVALGLTVLGLTALCVACEPPSSAGDGADGAGPDGQGEVASTSATAADLDQSAWQAAEGLTQSALMATVQTLAADDMAGRDNLTAGGEKARNWIITQLEAIGLEPAGQSGWSQPFAQGVNLAARLPGSDPALAHEVLVIGAHYDHLGQVGVKSGAGGAPRCLENKASPSDTICNGALDNASGVATVLAIARALKQADLPLRRSVLFLFFDAEEDGLLGSTWFVEQQPLVPIAQVVAMFSVDMVGGALFEGEPSNFAVDIEFSEGLRDKLADASKRLGFFTWPVSSFFVGQDDGGRSDHYPFRKAGVPSLFFSCGAPPSYHTPLDEPKLLQPAKLLATARHVLLTAAAVANDEARPKFVPGGKPHLGDAQAMVFLADMLLDDPAKAGLQDNKTALTLLTKWRAQLQAWLDKPPQTEAQWQEYDKLVRSIVAAAFAAMKM